MTHDAEANNKNAPEFDGPNEMTDNTKAKQQEDEVTIKVDVCYAKLWEGISNSAATDVEKAEDRSGSNEQKAFGGKLSKDGNRHTLNRMASTTGSTNNEQKAAVEPGNDGVKANGNEKQEENQSRISENTESSSPKRRGAALGKQQEERAQLKLTSKLHVLAPRKLEEPKSKKREKAPKNELTIVIPSYTAKMQLDSSSLNSQKRGLEASRKRALVTDKTTSPFVKGSLPNHKQARQVLASSLTVKKVVSSFKLGTKREAPMCAGEKWFRMTPTRLTEEVQRDLHVIRSRTYLDPRRFYKSTDKESKVIQVGTVIEGNAEFYSSRLNKKQRRSNLTEEMMADQSVADYAHRKFRVMQQEKKAKIEKQGHKKKTGKRAHA